MMKKVLIVLVLIFSQIPAFATLPLNCFEPQFGGARVQHKRYYGERWIEPYRWGNYFEKPFKDWYQKKINDQRNQIRKDYERNGIIKFTMPDVPFW